MIYLLLFLEFFKIGAFTFGGGFAMIPLVQQTVSEYGWLSESQFANFIGVCESTPGPIAINMATYVGAVQGGFFGSVCATLGVVLPSFIVILLIASILKGFTQSRWFKAFISGAKPVIAALILSTGVCLTAGNFGYGGKTSFSPDYLSMVLFIAVALFSFVYARLKGKRPGAIVLIGIGAALGVIGGLLQSLL